MKAQELKNGKGYIISRTLSHSRFQFLFFETFFQPIEARVTAVVVSCICNFNSICRLLY